MAMDRFDMDRFDQDDAPGKRLARTLAAVDEPGKARRRTMDIVTERLRKKIGVRRTISAAVTRRGA